MTEQAIVFTGDSVRGILEDRKTTTRRLRGLAKINERPGAWRYDGLNVNGDHLFFDVDGALCGVDPQDCSVIVRCPYGKPGHLLWVRETWCPASSDDGPVVCYKANLGRRYLVDESYPVEYERFPAGKGAWSVWASDLEAGIEGSWRSPIHMPRWSSRITLKITEMCVQRLQEITMLQAMSEGIQIPCTEDGVPCLCVSERLDVHPLWANPQKATLADYFTGYFALAWDHINGKRAPWASNPWVWVIGFQRISRCP